MKFPLWARHTSFAVALLALSSTSLMAQQTPAGAPTDITVGGITKPSIHAKLALPQFGQVLELPVKEGDVVKKDQVLLRQDDRQEVAMLEALRLEAESNVRVEAAEADLKIKEVQHKRLKDLAANGNANPTEVEEAWVKVVYADAQAKIARLENTINKQKFLGQEIKVKLMSLRSPIDGIVETLDVSLGEVTDPQKPVMTIVKNDPLWIEFFLPTMQSSKLKVGQQLEVRYAGQDQAQWQPAKVIYKAPVADAASDTQKMRLELANPKMTDSGLQVMVRLPGDIGPAQRPSASLNTSGLGGSATPALAGSDLPAASPVNAR